MSKEKKVEEIIEKKQTCGIVMPISSIDNCSAEHWKEVLVILKDAIKDAGFEPNLVSDADDSGIIQKRIIQNLYKNEIVVCDVSAKNPNVMFELGLRLAFDKPTIIIKDDKTDYSFDTSVIEHVSYPRDLRFTKILNFKETLKNKIKNTFEKSEKDPNYTTFLKHFGEYKIAELSQKEVSSDRYILSAIDEIKRSIKDLKYRQVLTNNNSKINSRIAQEIIRVKLNQFMEENKIKHEFDIVESGRLEELIDYLEGDSDVTLACEDPLTLRNIVYGLMKPHF